MIWGSKITGVDTPPLASKLLVTNAYSQAQGGRRLAGKNPAVGEPEVPGADRTSVAARALKTEFLKSLHAQSNAGLVSIKDVAHALDHILKRDALK